MRLIHVAGAKGVGKSSILSQLSLSTRIDYSIKLISISHLLFNTAPNNFGLQWTALTDEQKCQVRENVVTNILSLPYDIVIMDSHYIEMEEGSSKCIVSPGIETFIDCHILIEAYPEIILERR